MLPINKTCHLCRLQHCLQHLCKVLVANGNKHINLLSLRMNYKYEKLYNTGLVGPVS